MSWEVSKVEHLRMEFVLLAREEWVSMTEVCREFGISRKTGYKWLRRYEAEGLRGLSDRSRRPHSSPFSVSGEVVLALVRLRGEHPFWGPKKLVRVLQGEGIEKEEIPSLATIGRILQRAGMTEAKGRGRPRRWDPEKPLQEAGKPNDVWTVDFKGWWRTGDGRRCEPLSVRDLYSRYLLCLRPMHSRKTEAVQEVFQEVFERYGLPEVIRSDNGGPFASMTGPHGLTRLSAWWRSLGIRLDRIDPGHPEQNGGHERMHGDVAREIAARPSRTLEEETERLERWRIEYDVERPHEALGMKTPGECYRCSTRRLASVEPYRYPPEFERRSVRRDGYIKFEGRPLYVSEALARHPVALHRLTETTWRVWFCDLEIGEIESAPGAALRPLAYATPPVQREPVLPMS